MLHLTGIVWNILNGMLYFASSYAQFLYGLLPNDPLALPSWVATNLSPFMGQVNYFLPLALILGMMASWLLAITSVASVFIVMHQLESVEILGNKI